MSPLALQYAIVGNFNICNLSEYGKCLISGIIFVALR